MKTIKCVECGTETDVEDHEPEPFQCCRHVWAVGDRFEKKGERMWTDEGGGQHFDTFTIEGRVTAVAESGLTLEWERERTTACHLSMPGGEIGMLVPDKGGFTVEYAERIGVRWLPGERVIPPLYQVEFGREFPVPQAVLDRVAAETMEDTSWHNDVCPSFTSKDGNIVLWVDYPKKKDRELGGERFMVTDNSYKGWDGKQILYTNKLAEALAAFDKAVGEYAGKEPEA